MNPWDRIHRFIEGFSQQHFPLNTWYLAQQEEWLEQEEDPEYSAYNLLRDGIPFALFGFTHEDYHEVYQTDRLTRCLTALMIITNPDYLMSESEDEAAREVSREGLARLMPLEMLRELPPAGFDPDIIWAALQGTPLEPLGLGALWLAGATHNFFLDRQMDWEIEAYYSTPWDDENVQWLSGEWQEARRIMERVSELETWMERDFGERAQAAVRFLLERVQSIPQHFLTQENQLQESQSQESQSQESQSQESQSQENRA